MKLQARHLISSLLALALVALSLSFTSGTAQASSSYSSYVTSYTLKVRSKASTHYRTLRTLNMGNKVTVTSKYGKYSRIKYGNTTGYVQTQHLSRSKYKSYSAYVTSYTLKVRSKASVHYSTKRTLNMANKVTVLGKGNKYALIKYGSTTGYVQNIHLNKSKFKSLSAYVTSYTLKVRSAASVHYTLQSTLAMGNKVTVLGKGNKYALISYGGKTGYVQNIHLNSQAFRSYNAYVTSNTLKIRDNASVHYNILSTMKKTDQVSVTGYGNKYAQVIRNGIKGYVQKKYLSTTKPLSYDVQPITVYQAYIGYDKLKVFQEPLKNAAVIGTLREKTKVNVIGQSGDWRKIQYESLVGFVDKKYLETDLNHFNPPTTSTSDFGVDISHYQGSVDVNAIKNAGNRFIIVKATEGPDYKTDRNRFFDDAYFESNAVSASKIGLNVHAYYFFRATNEDEARNEASHFINVINNARNKGAKIQYLFLDVETTNGVSKDQLTKNVLAFLAQMRANGMNQLGIYSGLSFYNNSLDLPQIVESQKNQSSKFLVWLSRYRGKDSYLGPGFTADIWQYTSYGTSSGVVGAVDKDIWYYTVNGL
ncbi:SH3 domain-containing protein [Sporolactobacillus sp. STCC-11]|uniref:SH3 domain-containing protein n=1 Tax=Sporolactobacillus caesalpiniae TaxID=3230362 RepID=UPI0033940406